MLLLGYGASTITISLVDGCIASTVSGSESDGLSATLGSCALANVDGHDDAVTSINGPIAIGRFRCTTAQRYDDAKSVAWLRYAGSDAVASNGLADSGLVTNGAGIWYASYGTRPASGRRPTPTSFQRLWLASYDGPIAQCPRLLRTAYDAVTWRLVGATSTAIAVLPILALIASL